ncbi:hypothetical protein D0469_18920 [Peribacillus saganii]|uniref:YheE family protein n=1 Tax=Peribacillus saganii TaxID=2303992 RepID=A0A372LE01_9BACI|nr:YheE family protein [Peribacillus saganii]RFU64442.1 hypothetical protein D0469_18920 [Peribacillus saganii]
MLTHFQWKNLYSDKGLPGWNVSFYYQKQLYRAIYHPNGTIEWTGNKPLYEEEESLKGSIHELMLYHVYDDK